MAERSAVLHLASRSPRRAELLTLLGVAFERIDVEVDEAALPAEPADAYVERVARAKATAARAALPGTAPLLAADTTVSLDGRIFGKPADGTEAMAMLGALSGRTHLVHTAVVVDAGRALCEVVATRVEFAAFDGAAIANYVASGEPLDKAGAYGIQGLGGALVVRIEGSYSAVVGLPLVETARLLAAAGVPHRLHPG